MRGRLVAACCSAPLRCRLRRPTRTGRSRSRWARGCWRSFPPSRGTWSRRAAARPTSTWPRKDLVQPGMELQVYRPGAEMVHPVTKQVLGTYEKNLGVLSVTEVRDTYSRGTLDAAGAAAGIVAGRPRPALGAAAAHAAARRRRGPGRRGRPAGPGAGRARRAVRPVRDDRRAGLGAGARGPRRAVGDRSRRPRACCGASGSWRRRTCCCSRGSSRAPPRASRRACARCAPARCWGS